MGEGTVRGTFDLNSAPAKRELRELRREGAKTDVTMRQLGGTLDRMGTQAKSIRAVTTEMKTLRREGIKTEVELRRTMESKTRAVHEQRRAISTLRKEVRALGLERATPSVDLTGINRALAQVELLHNRLAALGRQRATPGVGIGGGFGGAGGGGGGAGGFSTRGRGVLDFGRKGLSPRSAAIGAGLFLAQPLLTGATGILGSAGGAALGAGAVGTAGLGTAAVGLAGIISVAKPAMNGLKAVAQAQQKYNNVVADYGRKSKQAAAARRELNQAEKAAPGAQAVVQQARGFGREWRQLTAPGRRSFNDFLSGSIRAGRRAAPNMAYNANRSTAAFSREGQNFSKFLAGGETQRTVSTLTSEFVRDLPFAERILENIATTLERVAVAARPFFHDAVVWTEHWTRGWRESTRDIAGTRRSIGGLVSDFKDWRNLTGSTFHLLKDIFNMGRPSGSSMVVSLTRTIDRWDTFITRNPQKVNTFFRDAEKNVSAVAGAIASIAGGLSRIASLLTPILTKFAKLADFAGGSGLLIPLLGRAAFGGGRRGGGAGGAGGVPLIGGFGGRGGGGAGGFGGRTSGGMSTLSYLAPSYRGTGAGASAAMSARSSALLYMGAVGARGMTSHITSRLPGGGMATPETFGARYGNVAGARYAGPVSQLGARTSAAARARAGARSAGGAAGRFLGPISAIMAAEGAAITPGTAPERIQGALSLASFGIIAPPVTGRMARDQGTAQAIARLQSMPRARSSGDIRGQIASLRGLRGQALAGTHQTATGFFGGHGALGLFDAGRGNDSGPSDEAVKRRIARAAAYSKAIRGLNRELKDWQLQEGRTANAMSQQHGRQLASQLGGTFRQFAKKDTPEGAMRSTVDVMLGRMRNMRPAGAKVLGQNMLAWAHEMERHNPKLKGVVNSLGDDIEARMHALGKNIRVINGRIYTGSRSEWSKIARAMRDPIEQAKQSITAGFTAIQRQALAALTTMGYSGSEARAIISGQEAGGAKGAGAKSLLGLGANAADRSMSADRASQRAKQRATGARARGGVFGGSGLSDSIRLPSGDSVAPGEAWIANRHTLGDLSRATLAMYGKTAQQMITGESRRHSMRGFARGGATSRNQRALDTGGGLQGGINQALQMIIGQFPGLQITSTTGGRHAAGSYHYRGMAVDLGGSTSLMDRAAGWIAANMGSGLTEGIHNPNLSIKNGRAVSPNFWGASTWRAHANHIHLAVAGALGRLAGVSMAGGGAGGSVSLNAPRSGVRGVSGALADRATAAYASGLMTKINTAIGGGGPGTGGRLGRGQLARLWVGAGGPSSVADMMAGIALRESGGDPNAINQNTNGTTDRGLWQINSIWGKYSRFGTNANALSAVHVYNTQGPTAWSTYGHARGGRAKFGGWHRKGLDGITNGPTLFGAGEDGRRERVKITPISHGSADGDGHKIEVHFNGDVHMRSDADIDELGRKVAAKILDELRAA